MGINEVIQLIAATLGSLGFSVLFNIKGKKLIGVTLGGFIGWLAYVIYSMLMLNDTLCYFLAAVTISIYAEIMARVMKCPVTVIIAPSLIPLVPGASLYYTMAHILSDSGEFAHRAFTTLAIAAALAGGIIFSAIVTTLVTKIRVFINQKHHKTR